MDLRRVGARYKHLKNVKYLELRNGENKHELVDSRSETTKGVSGKPGFQGIRKISAALQNAFSSKQQSCDDPNSHSNNNNSDDESQRSKAKVELNPNCVSCNAVRPTGSYHRIRMTSPGHKEDACMSRLDYNRRNFTHHMSPIIVQYGRVQIELPLSAVSNHPLLVYPRNSHLLIDVDNSQRYCTSCNESRRVSVPYPIGFIDLPNYGEASSVTLTYMTDKDTVKIDCAVKQAQNLDDLSNLYASKS